MLLWNQSHDIRQAGSERTGQTLREMRFLLVRRFINPLAPELFFFNLTHPVYKM